MKPSFPLARFAAKVELAPSGCWLWTAGTTTDGYGMFRLDGRTRLAHRLAYEWIVGPIPDGLQLDHTCRTPSCVNPAHLEPVTAGENIRRAAQAKTTCRNGHPYVNPIVEPSGRRRCRTCRSEGEKARHDKRMDAQRRRRAERRLARKAA